jgi:hypothetical protein
LVTDVERNDILGRPHPDAVRANIQRVTGDQMSTVAKLISKTRTDVQSLSKDELELMFNNFNKDSFMWMKQFNDAPGAKEAQKLLLPAEDRAVVMAVSQYRIMGPETNWEAYLAARQEESERRQAAEAKRMEEFNRVIAEQNARESRRQQLYQQRDALGEDEFRRQLALTNLDLCVNSGSSTIIHPKNTPRYDPVRENFVSPSHEDVEKQPSVADATPLDEENRTIMQSNAIVDDTNVLNGQRELGASSKIEHFQQRNRPDGTRRLSTNSSHRAHPYNTALRRSLTPVQAATGFATSSRGPLRQRSTPGNSSASIYDMKWISFSPYTRFASEQREKLMEENPDVSLDRIEIEMDNRWRAMSAEERSPYTPKGAFAAMAAAAATAGTNVSTATSTDLLLQPSRAGPDPLELVPDRTRPIPAFMADANK